MGWLGLVSTILKLAMEFNKVACPSFEHGRSRSLSSPL